MEEKLRNLSQNIENNTGLGAHKPEETPPPEEHHEESHDEPREEEHHEKSHDEPPMDEAEENVPEQEEPEPEPEPKEEPKILTMTEEDEPQESPTRAKKYSPEVEAALNRLNAEDASFDYSSEPLSTEPKKKHHAGHIFLVFLLILAIAAAVLCVLVEQKIIDNPLNLLGTKKPETSQEETKKTPTPIAKTTEPVTLTDNSLITAIDVIFEKNVQTDNYYVFSRTSQALNGKDYIYYDVAETPAVDCDTATTDCVVAKITADNYKNYPAYRYTFVKVDFDVYEFSERAPLAESKVVDDVTSNLNNSTEEKK